MAAFVAPSADMLCCQLSDRAALPHSSFTFPPGTGSGNWQPARSRGLPGPRPAATAKAKPGKAYHCIASSTHMHAALQAAAGSPPHLSRRCSARPWALAVLRAAAGAANGVFMAAEEVRSQAHVGWMWRGGHSLVLLPCMLAYCLLGLCVSRTSADGSTELPPAFRCRVGLWEEEVPL